MSFHLRLRMALICLLAGLALAGCNLPGSAGPAAPAAGETVAPAGAPSAAPTDMGFAAPTEPPTATPQPDTLALLALEGVDTGQATAVQELLGELAAKHGLQFKTLTELSGQQLGPEVRVAVALAPDFGLQSLANANPGVQFLALGVPGIEPGVNVSVVTGGGARPDEAAFVAGYLAALITQDWRVGVISRGDSPAGKAARNGFLNGAVFYCGLCRPALPPFVQYPVFVDLAEGQSGAEAQAAAGPLIANAVQTVYVAPGAGDAALVEYLAGQGLRVIGGETPPPAAAGQWVATLRADETGALQQAVERLLNGETGFTIASPLGISAVNPGLLSGGRQRLVDNLLADLLAGYIDTGVNLETGELK
ncbi:MAG: hypothetical protein ACKOC5_06455 [Chloroflexota bacterium]